MIRRLVVVALAGVALSFAPSARAGLTKLQCARANADGQASRHDGKLGDTRTSLQLCIDPTCPAIVRDDCAQRLSEVEHAQPSIIFDAKNGTGEDVGAVHVSIDGHPLPEPLQGRPLLVDPGDHVFIFTAAGLPPLTRRFVLKEGEKDRRERVVIGPIPVPVAPVETTDGLGTRKVVALSVAGVGAIGLVVGSIFGVETLSASSAQKSDCGSATTCKSPGAAQTEHSTAETDAVVSTAAFLVGGALLVGGAYLFFTKPAADVPAKSSFRVVPILGPSGGGVSLRVEF